MLIVSQLFHSEAEELAGYANSIQKLYEECIPANALQRGMLTRLIDIWAAALVTLIKYAIIIFGLSSLLVNIDPLYLLLRHYSHYRIPWLLYRYVGSPLGVIVLTYNCSLTVLNFALLIVLSGLRVLLVLYSSMHLPVATTSVLCPLPKQFLAAMRLFSRLSLQILWLNETGRVAHPLIAFVGFLCCSLSASVLILGVSKLAISPFLLGVSFVFFVTVMGMVMGGLSAAAMVYELSVAYKGFWTGVGICWSGYARRRLGSGRSVRLKLESMGYVDKSFVLTYLNSMLSCLVNVVMFTG